MKWNIDIVCSRTANPLARNDQLPSNENLKVKVSHDRDDLYEISGTLVGTLPEVLFEVGESLSQVSNLMDLIEVQVEMRK
jgi:hypothetical protein